MERVASILLCLALLTSCTDPAPKTPAAESDAEALVSALESEAWTQETPFDLGAFADVTSSRAAQDDAVGVVQISPIDAPDTRSGGGPVNITYIVFESDEEASTALEDFVADFADHEYSRPIEGSPGICVTDGDNNDECNTAEANVMVRVFSRLGGVPDPAQTEELMHLALAHLRR